jgi:hypothetical protein
LQLFLVVFYIPGKFILPEFRSSIGSCSALTPFMAMPKASVNKDHRFIFCQKNIRFTWQSSGIVEFLVYFTMQSESISKRMKQFVYNDLRFGICRPNPAHIPASMLLGYFVGHILF